MKILTDRLGSITNGINGKKWSKEIPVYGIEIDGVNFIDMTKEQYELLYRLKGST